MLFALGDTNSVLSTIAAKIKIPIFHMESEEQVF
jgi:UDP-N-acetylglucosamine 2-epimerase